MINLSDPTNPHKGIRWDLLNPLPGSDQFEVYHLSSHRRLTPEFHSHDFYELYFYLSGDASMYIEEYALRMHPGDVFLLPPGHMHRAFHHTVQAYYDRFFIYISRESLARMSSEEYSLPAVLENAAERSHFRCHPPDKAFSHALSQMNDIMLSAPSADAHQRYVNDCQMRLLLAQLCKWFSDRPNQNTSYTPRAIADVITYINANLEKDLSLDTLSAQFFINKYHLLREFKTYAQTTLYQYILSKRINRAKDLLRTGTPPALARELCGFNDYSSFYKAFKKQTLMSPQRYAEFTDLSVPVQVAAGARARPDMP